MNNEQFRRLLADNNASGKKSSSSSSETPRNGTGAGGATPMLGSRMRSSIPMTPRSVTGIDFARQLADQRREEQQPPTKRFKSSAAPKGTKLPSGYQDRAQLRQTADEENEGDIEKRIKALEEMVKLGQIEQGTFDKLRAELGVGGNLGSTHMVKGLDWELLKRVRAGEDVERAKEEEQKEEVPEVGEGDVDDEFDRVLEERGKDVLPTAPKEKKKGTMAPPPPPRRSRDEILRQLKASRAPAKPAEPELGNRFKKIGESKSEKKRWIEEENGRRKEILLITDAEGKTKRKTRWLDKPGEVKPSGKSDLLVPDKDAKPLGMEVPEIPKAPEAEEDDDDIFAGVGDDYNPLGDLNDEDSDESDEGEVSEKKPATSENKPAEATAPRPRNYFSTTTIPGEPSEPEDRSNPLTKDPTIRAALKRAAALRQASPSDEAGEGEDVDNDTLLRRKRFLEERRRREQMDAMDMDMGFGGSRIDDEEDDEPVVFEERGGNKRKRGPKKRKGDKNSAEDVLRVMGERKE